MRQKEPKSVSAELLKIRQEHYVPLRGNLPLESRSYLKLDELATRMAAVLNTNIREHFWKRQLQYLMELKDDLTREQAKAMQQKINEKKKRHDSLPEGIVDDVAYHLKAHPEDFLFPMWRMATLLERNNKKIFALLPLSKGFVPGASLHLDTDALLNVVGQKHELAQVYLEVRNKRLNEEKLAEEKKCMEEEKKNKEETMKDERKQEGGKKRQHEEVEEKATTAAKRKKRRGKNTAVKALDEKDLLWNAFFKMTKVLRPSRISKGKLRFGHHITTDGVSVSLSVLYAEKGEEEEGEEDTKQSGLS